MNIKRWDTGGVIYMVEGDTLAGADLSGVNLSNAYLADEDLSGANLRRADLSGANLNRTDLSRADLSEAILIGATLYGADLRNTNLCGVTGVDPHYTNLSGAKLNEGSMKEEKKMNEPIRKPIAVATTEHNITVLCDDGSVWDLYLDNKSTWFKMPPIPGTEADA